MIGKTNATGSGGVTPSGTLSITENGVYDVASYASASVNVSGGGEDTLLSLMTRTLVEYSGPLYKSMNGSYKVPSNIFTGQPNLSKAFFTSISMTGTSIPIEASAFYACASLRECNLLSLSQDMNGNTLKINYGANAFGQCFNLSTPVENAFGTIGFNAFASCSLLTRFRAVNSANNASISIAEGAFMGCIVLSDFYISASTIAITGSYPLWSTPIEDLSAVLNPTVTLSLGAFAFAHMHEVKKAILSYVSLNQYGGSYFYGCSKVSVISLTCKNTYNTIMSGFAYGCWALEEFYVSPMASSITISASAFAYCSKLTTIPFESRISWLYSNAFAFAGIKSFTTSLNVGVSSQVFAGNSFRYLSVGSITCYVSNAFRGCNNLSYVNVGNTAILGSSMFADCRNLGSILTSKATTISAWCFQNCSILESVYVFTSTVPTMQNYNAFAGNCPINTQQYFGRYGSIYVPASLYDNFITATNWVSFASRIVSLTDAEIETITTAYNNVSYIAPEE